MLTEAKGVSTVTLVGYMFNKFPTRHGNCFKVMTDDSEYVSIVNMNHENLKHLINNHVVSFPIQIDMISDNHAIVVDKRIPADYLDSEYCTICTPHKLLPLEQQEKIKAKEDEDIKSGKLTIHCTADGYSFYNYKIDAKPRTLKASYTINYENDIITVGDNQSLQELVTKELVKDMIRNERIYFVKSLIRIFFNSVKSKVVHLFKRESK